MSRMRSVNQLVVAVMEPGYGSAPVQRRRFLRGLGGCVRAGAGSSGVVLPGWRATGLRAPVVAGATLWRIFPSSAAFALRCLTAWYFGSRAFMMARIGVAM